MQNLTPGQVHAVPADLTLAHRLTPDGPPAAWPSRMRSTTARCNACSTHTNPTRTTRPSSTIGRSGTRSRKRPNGSTGTGMADAMASLPRPARLLPSCALLNWAVDVVDAAVGGMTMPAMPRGLDGERKRAEARLNAIMPTGIEAICEGERLKAFADVCRAWT